MIYLIFWYRKKPFVILTGKSAKILSIYEIAKGVIIESLFADLLLFINLVQMAINEAAYLKLKHDLNKKNITLVAVSKKKTVDEIMQLYQLGQRDFGENYVQELMEKQPRLPEDIHWHFIGHLQRNKVKQILPFIYLIQGVDSFALLKEIEKQAKKINRSIDCLLQVFIADEETKYGFDPKEIIDYFKNKKFKENQWVSIKGLMGMATFTEAEEKIRKEFHQLNELYQLIQTNIDQPFQYLSMGMSGDYTIAMEANSNMVRIGSLIFGNR